MTSIRFQIAMAIHEIARLLPGVAECEFMPSDGPTNFRAIHLYDYGHRILEQEAGASRYDMALSIEGYVEGDGGATAALELDALYTAVVMALIDEPPPAPLADLVETIDEGDLSVFIARLADTRRLGFSLEILITFSTRRGRPAEQS